jgi:hypothetical protein
MHVLTRSPWRRGSQAADRFAKALVQRLGELRPRLAGFIP